MYDNNFQNQNIEGFPDFNQSGSSFFIPSNQAFYEETNNLGNKVSAPSNGPGTTTAFNRPSHEAALLSTEQASSAVGQAPALENNKDNAANAQTQIVKATLNDYLRKYEIQKINQKILLESKSKAFKSSVLCGRKTYDTQTNATVNATADKKIAFGNVFRCASPWSCPRCSSLIRLQRSKELLNISDNLQQHGYNGLFITLTLQHSKNENVKDLLALPNEAWRAMTAKRAYKEYVKRFAIHYVKSFEITYSDKNGFHPHLHVLLYYKGGYEVGNDLELYIKAAWKGYFSALGRKAEQLVFEKVYNAQLKGGVTDYVTKSQTAYELSTSHFKAAKDGHVNPLNIPVLIYDCDNSLSKIKNPEKVYQDYAAAVKGLRSITFSKGIKNYLTIEEKTEEEAVTSTESFIDLIYLLTPKAYDVLVKYDLINNFRSLIHLFYYTDYNYVIAKINSSLHAMGFKHSRIYETERKLLDVVRYNSLK